jgi:hypothetical protein
VNDDETQSGLQQRALKWGEGLEAARAAGGGGLRERCAWGAREGETELRNGSDDSLEPIALHFIFFLQCH